ncbi:Rpn family recombination-promoting nuclease/putative transposase [Desulfosporosinus shakirovi]|uniref:Rpn family recombination-promoting nuclease/putative transposase n=1 Tax=Desulfosporosinus shakirovi TaxID=2885154 RepID=UPI001E39F902|nr:Rpn family recombination-promoting nuclease/putative transposase [Desulfosporosinus sp. SRJS8]MCB8814737.1 Rpn family recombination-promoting nuclease/putative transposase [Desulfosporosinus sp. SRJS8]
MRQLIDLKIDYAFKLIFGKPGNEPILMAFLNAALKLPYDNQIKSVLLLNTELDKEYKDDKKSVLDIRAVTDEGIQVNIEIQLANRHDMDKRTLFYWAKMYTRQMREGMAYLELAKTITINILDFRYINQTRSYHSVFRLFEVEEGFELTEALEIHFMELPKLLVKWREGLVSPREDALVRWLFLLEGSENEEIYKILEEIAMKDPVLNQAIEEWEKSSDDPRIREIYWSRQKAILDEKAAIREAELRLREAIKEGKEEGKKENKLEVAQKMLNRGMDIQVISEIVGISEEEIKNLKR